MFGFIKKIFGSKSDRDMKEYRPLVDAVNEEFEKLQGLSLDELRNKTLEFRERINEHLEGINTDIDNITTEAQETNDFDRKEELYEELDELKEERDKHIEEILKEIRPEAFAVVKEAARRFSNNPTLTVTATEHDQELAVKKDYITIEGDKAVWQNSWDAAGATITWNMVHYDVQLIGGAVLHDGKIAEMATGEGKTLVATLPAYLNGLTGLGVHVVTVNDYLARRDCEWIGPLMEFLYLTIDCIDNYKPHSPGRIEAYKCDITYGTNNEFGFDYLRDNMVRTLEEKVQGKHHFAMVDEIDSVLIDDARTPLIISGPASKSDVEVYSTLKPRVQDLLQAQRKLAGEYLTIAKKLIAEGNTGVEEGEGGLALLRAFRAFPNYRPLTKFVSQQGMKAVLQATENHYMREQSKHMPLADAPLYYSLDEKNRQVDLTEKGAEFLGGEETDMFVLDDITTEIMEIEEDTEMTLEDKATAKDQALDNFADKTQRLHAVNQLLKAYSLFEKDDHYLVTNGQVMIIDEQTGRVMEGRRYSDGLHQALEAKEGVKIGEITQTYATVTLQNFFRMYHKLSGMTGTAETEAGEFWEIYKLDVCVIPTNRPIARDDREDLIYKTENAKIKAIITEIQKLSGQGRPVLVGTTTVEMSEKLSRILNLRNIPHNVLNAKQHAREAAVVAEAGNPGKITIATNMAGRGTDIKLSDEVKANGGLAILGTARHDSRRVDRQLRGRAGRQGDPGSSQFFISLEDNLMRMFHSERITKIMDRMGYDEDEVIQHSMVTKSIERAQKRVEENNFGIRKRLLEYDDVMSVQRNAIYSKRNNALEGDRLSVEIYNMFLDFSTYLIRRYKASEDFEGLKIDLIRFFNLNLKMDAAYFKESSLEDVAEEIQDQILEEYKKKKAVTNQTLLATALDVKAIHGERYKRVFVPYHNGSLEKEPLRLSIDIDNAIATQGADVMDEIEQMIVLRLIDNAWKDHLRGMDEIKESTRAASFEQKDPLVVYKIEAFDLFKGFIHQNNSDIITYLFKGDIVTQKDNEQPQEAKEEKTDFSNINTNRREEEPQRQAQAQSNRPQPKVETVRRSQPKVGRNEPCPCGSGKKYKKCHGK